MAIGPIIGLKIVKLCAQIVMLRRLEENNDFISKTRHLQDATNYFNTEDWNNAL